MGRVLRVNCWVLASAVGLLASDQVGAEAKSVKLICSGVEVINDKDLAALLGYRSIRKTMIIELMEGDGHISIKLPPASMRIRNLTGDIFGATAADDVFEATSSESLVRHSSSRSESAGDVRTIYSATIWINRETGEAQLVDSTLRVNIKNWQSYSTSIQTDLQCEKSKGDKF